MAPSVKMLTKRPNSGDPINEYEKPVSVARHLLGMFARPGERVLICGTGSGSEVVAAMSLGLSVTGIELAHDQFIASQERIGKYAAQLSADDEGSHVPETQEREEQRFWESAAKPLICAYDAKLKVQWIKEDNPKSSSDKAPAPTPPKESTPVCFRCGSSRGHIIRCATCLKNMHASQPGEESSPSCVTPCPAAPDCNIHCSAECHV